MCHDNKEWCKIWSGIECFQNPYEEFSKFPDWNMTNLKSKMAELNRNENSKRLDWPDAMK